MTNDEKILQLLANMQKDMTEVRQEMTEVRQEMTEVRQEMTEVRQEIAGIKHDVAEVKQEVVKINIKIENDITKRLDTLAEGFMLNLEASTELKERVEALETKVG